MTTRDLSQLFSPDYSTARQRLLDAANQVGASIHSHRLSRVASDETSNAASDTTSVEAMADRPANASADASEDLAIDVVTLGDERAPTVLISSGLHGVEGFFGSAIQLAILRERAESRLSTQLSKVRLVLVHALNPFGFSRVRRANEHNVDLNRNFLLASEDYRGAPTAYARLNPLLNPPRPPSSIDLFFPKAIWVIARNGLQPMKQAVAGGQHDYARGLFFGGNGPSETMQILRRECEDWIGGSKRVLHIDLHSGLGPFATYKLLLNASEDTNAIDWYAHTFGNDCLEVLDGGRGTAYRIHGMFGDWMQTHFRSQSVDYRFVGAEFGTYSVLRVLAALRRENQAHHYLKADHPAYVAAKAELLECFCPRARKWRNSITESGIKIVEQAAAGILSGTSSSGR